MPLVHVLARMMIFYDGNFDQLFERSSIKIFNY